jgi:D-alanyl-D-alanine carboxypeptidase
MLAMLRAGAYWRHIENLIRAGYTAPAPSQARRARRLVLVGLAVVIAAIIGTFGHQSVSSSAASFDDVLRGDQHGALGEADGLVPDGASVFGDATPAVANLDPSLLKALRRAATDAAEDGVGLQVSSGWRSPEYQEQLLREAVAEYGSEEEAARWVATPETSAHVSGDAVDIRPSDAAARLSAHGAGYGLCQIYSNEPWHYELSPEAIDHGCPPMYADPARSKDAAVTSTLGIEPMSAQSPHAGREVARRHHGLHEGR